MKSTILKLALSGALAVAFALALFVDRVIDIAAATYRFGVKLVVNTFAGPVSLAPAADPKPAVRLQSARAFVLLRMIERKRPTVEPGSWRMCPSI